MPGRQSDGGAPAKSSKARANNKKRLFNAFSIAAKQTEDRPKVRQHRLGEVEGGTRPNKRNRDDEDILEGDSGNNHARERKALKKGRFDELDVEVGSDSDGNQWQLGHVDDDDDSDLDSDEAFGQSDEERFDGFTFSASSKNTKRDSRNVLNAITLDEDASEDDASDSDDLGDDAIDLAAMLDASGEQDAINVDTQGNRDRGNNVDEAEHSDDDGSLSSSSEEEEGEVELSNIAALQRLVGSLSHLEPADRATKESRLEHTNESQDPTDYGVSAVNKIQLEDLGLPSVQDPFVKKSLKLLAAETTNARNSKGGVGTLTVPLSRREQDRLDRAAAYEKSKETLARWTDTVKHNRRAEHLIFPLQDPEATSVAANNYLLQSNHAKPSSELETTIQSILAESGFVEANGKDDEDKVREFEELETNTMTLEEIKARRNQLRSARELLFREEARAKRIKKIKSRSYRKVHRKQREKEERLTREALAEAGIDPSEDEREARDRRRAIERMGDKHRGSKWAKTTKAIGRAAWDEDARASVTEMARRNEELRERIEGKASKYDSGDESSQSSEESLDSGAAFDIKDKDTLLKELKKLGGTDKISGSKLSNMKFMLKADAARKLENDQTIKTIMDDLAGNNEKGDDDDGSTVDQGRQTFGPQRKRKEATDNPIKMDELMQSGESHASLETLTDPKRFESNGAWSRPAKGSDAAKKSATLRTKNKILLSGIDEIDFTQAAVVAKQAIPVTFSKSTGACIKDSHTDNDSDGASTTNNLPYAVRNQDLVRRAFAGDDVAGEFDMEKRQVIDDEDEKVIDNTLPGWGSWAGEGLSKRERQKSKGRHLAKSEGIKEQDRKDARLRRVIINEKRIKKVCLTIMNFRAPD